MLTYSVNMEHMKKANNNLLSIRCLGPIILHLLFFVVSRSLCESFALGVRLVSPGKEIYKSARNVITVMLRRIHWLWHGNDNASIVFSGWRAQ